MSILDSDYAEYAEVNHDSAPFRHNHPGPNIQCESTRGTSMLSPIS
jgi:hypothetical protein